MGYYGTCKIFCHVTTINNIRIVYQTSPQPILILVMLSMIDTIISISDNYNYKLELVQYNAAVGVTGAMRVSSREKLYQELGLESFLKLCYFFKITKNQSLKYLFDKIPTTRTVYRTRNKIDNISWFNVKYTFFKNSIFLSTVIEWNNLDKSIRSSESFALFKKSILQFTRPSRNRTFNCHNPIGIKLITRLRLGLTHLQDHRFKD